jgi:hypothetical protein
MKIKIDSTETGTRIFPLIGMKILPWILVLAPALQAFFYVHYYGVSLVWLDQWDGMAPLFEKWHMGTLGFIDFWAQHNEHRCVIPRIIMFALGLLTRWNTIAEMYVIQLLLATVLFAFLYVFLRESTDKIRFWPVVPLSFLVFSLRQNENMLWGWQIGFVAAVAGAVLSLTCLHLLKNPGWWSFKYIAALLFATAATFSSAQGLLIWPVGLLILVPLARTQKNMPVIGWTVMGAIAWFAYFLDYVKPSAHPDLTFSVKYFLAIVGGALFPTIGPSIAAGVIIIFLSLLAVVLVLREKAWMQHSFWLAIIAFGLLIQLQITLARSGFGINQALSSRYATCSLLIVIGTYSILSNLSSRRSGNLVLTLRGIYTVLVLIGLFFSTFQGYENGSKRKQVAEYWIFLMCSIESQPDQVLYLSDNVPPALVRRVTRFLKEHKWNFFASRETVLRYEVPSTILPEIPLQATTAMSTFGPLENDPLIFVAAGWALDPAAEDLVGAVFLEIDGILYPTYYGADFGDPIHSPKHEELRYCGFQRLFPMSKLGDGYHQVAIKVLTKDRKAFFRPSPIGSR